MKKVTLFLLVSIALVNIVAAYPIAQRPLRILMKESQYIIIGYVVKVVSQPPGGQWKPNIAIIAIQERLQGNIKSDTIQVEYSAYMICPAPAKYVENTMVLTFLDKENGVYSPHALSYGAKTLNAYTMDIYKKRIIEMKAILKNTNHETRIKQTAEWLVTCAENPVSKWEGVCEFNWSPYAKTDETDYQKILTCAQKERLKKVLLASNVAEYGLIDIVYPGNEREIEKFLILLLKQSVEAKHFYITKLLYRIKGNGCAAQLRAITKQIESIELNADKSQEVVALVNAFIQLWQTSVSNPLIPLNT